MKYDSVSGANPVLHDRPGDRAPRFSSILFPSASPGTPALSPAVPEFFRDLNLDQLVDTIAAQHKDYEIAPFFYAPLADADEVRWRQDVMRDLERPGALAAVKAFSERIRYVRLCLPQEKKFYYRFQKERRLLEGADTYCGAVLKLRDDLRTLGPQSRGLADLLEYLADYTGAAAFRALADEARAARAALRSVRYGLLIDGDWVLVRRYEDEQDYGALVERLFARFRRAAAKDYRLTFPPEPDMNHIEAQILERVARLHPAPFADLMRFVARHAAFVDERVARFDREVQFYVAWLEHVARLRGAGLAFCYPQVERAPADVFARGTFDVALATRLAAEQRPVVANDFCLHGPERVIVVSGPNQGGKTTFARSFGQLHYLAALGCPVPGTGARLHLFDQLFTHFERPEAIETLRGKLQDDLVRVHRILERATPDSIVILNEVFASTTVGDALYLGTKIMERIHALDLRCVCVTFLDELASFSERTVSMVSQVDPADPALRTFRLERRPADGLAYAMAVADKRRVTYAWLMKRIAP